MVGMGFVTQWDAMAGLRVLLGLLEAGFFPSCVYLLSTWYTRCEWPLLLDITLLPSSSHLLLATRHRVLTMLAMATYR